MNYAIFRFFKLLLLLEAGPDPDSYRAKFWDRKIMDLLHLENEQTMETMTKH